MLKKDIPLSQCEIKLSKDGKGEFEGYASVFGGVDSYKDTIMPGAYAQTLKDDRTPKMFINHGSYEIPVGDWIELREDEVGLRVKGCIDLNHKDGPTVYSALKRGALDAMSIGYRVPPGGAIERDDGVTELHQIKLKEISLVNFPADDAARVSGVKADIEEIESLREAEQYLRDAGYSKSAAVAFVSRVKVLARRDAEQTPSKNTEDVTHRLVQAIRNA